MAVVELMYGWEEKEYWLRQLDTMVMMKVMVDRGYEDIDTQFDLNMSTWSNYTHNANLFVEYLQMLTLPYGIDFIDPSEEESEEHVIYKMKFHFTEYLTDEDMPAFNDAKRELGQCVSMLDHMDADSGWVDENVCQIILESYSGYGFILKHIMNAIERISPYLKEVTKTHVEDRDYIGQDEAAPCPA